MNPNEPNVAINEKVFRLFDPGMPNFKETGSLIRSNSGVKPNTSAMPVVFDNQGKAQTPPARKLGRDIGEKILLAKI